MPLLHGNKVAREYIDEEKNISQKVFNQVLGAIKKYDESDTGELKQLVTGQNITAPTVPTVQRQEPISQQGDNGASQLIDEIDKQVKIYSSNVNRRDYVEETKLMNDNVLQLSDKGIISSYNAFAQNVRNNNFVISNKEKTDVLKEFKKLDVAINRSINIRINDPNKNIYSISNLLGSLSTIDELYGTNIVQTVGDHYQIDIDAFHTLPNNLIKDLLRSYISDNKHRANLLTTFKKTKFLSSRNDRTKMQEEILHLEKELQDELNRINKKYEESQDDSTLQEEMEKADDDYTKERNRIQKKYDLSNSGYDNIANEIKYGDIPDEDYNDEDLDNLVKEYEKVEDMLMSEYKTILENYKSDYDDRGIDIKNLSKETRKHIDDEIMESLRDLYPNEIKLYESVMNNPKLELLKKHYPIKYQKNKEERKKMKMKEEKHKHRETYHGKKEYEQHLGEKQVNEQIFHGVLETRLRTMSQFVSMCIKTTAISLFAIKNIEDMTYMDYSDVDESNYINLVVQMFNKDQGSPIKEKEYVQDFILKEDYSGLFTLGKKYTGKGKRGKKVKKLYCDIGPNTGVAYNDDDFNMYK